MTVKVTVELKTKDGKVVKLNEAEAKEVYEQLKNLYEQKVEIVTIPFVKPYDWRPYYYTTSGGTELNCQYNVSES